MVDLEAPRHPTPPEMQLLLHCWLIVQGFVLGVEHLDDCIWTAIGADDWHDRWRP